MSRSIRTLTAAVLLVTAASGCASSPKKPANPTVLQAPPKPEVVKVVQPVPVYRTIMPQETKTRLRRELTPIEATRRAAREGRFVPDPRDFIHARYRPPFVKDFHYEIYAAAGDGLQTPNMTDIELQAGEVPYSVVVADNVLWEVSYDYYGDGSDRIYTIHVKPKRPYKSTMLSISTNRRKYPLALRSFKHDRHVMVSFTYPEEEMIRLNASLPKPPRPIDGPAARDDPLPACRDGRYRVDGDSIAWTPVVSPEGLPAVCNDGARTRINFPPSLGAIPAPSLFQADAAWKNLRPANYRVIGANMVVDGLPRHILLRQGVDEVRIRHTGGAG